MSTKITYLRFTVKRLSLGFYIYTYIYEPRPKMVLLDTPPKNAVFAAHGQWLKDPLPLPGSCFQLLSGDYETFAQNFCEGGGLKYRNYL